MINIWRILCGFRSWIFMLNRLLFFVVDWKKLFGRIIGMKCLWRWSGFRISLLCSGIILMRFGIWFGRMNVVCSRKLWII